MALQEERPQRALIGNQVRLQGCVFGESKAYVCAATHVHRVTTRNEHRRPLQPIDPIMADKIPFIASARATPENVGRASATLCASPSPLFQVALPSIGQHSKLPHHVVMEREEPRVLQPPLWTRGIRSLLRPRQSMSEACRHAKLWQLKRQTTRVTIHHERPKHNNQENPRGWQRDVRTCEYPAVQPNFRSAVSKHAVCFVPSRSVDS